MSEKITFNSLLVPTDFSEHSWNAFQHALRLIDGEDAELVVVHVIDSGFVDQVAQLGMSEREQILELLKDAAHKNLKPYQDATTQETNVDTLVCEGEPFLEIIKKADDFAVDAIVMSKLGHRGQANSLLFGTTAEKVTRGSRKPVMVLPNQ